MNIPYAFKECSKCGEWLVANKINFHKKKDGKWGLESRCKKCKNKDKKEHYENNKEYKKEYSKKHYENNKEYYKEYRNQLCYYDGKKLTLHALYSRFRKAGIEHPIKEAKKYLVL